MRVLVAHLTTVDWRVSREAAVAPNGLGHVVTEYKTEAWASNSKPAKEASVAKIGEIRLGRQIGLNAGSRFKLVECPYCKTEWWARIRTSKEGLAYNGICKQCRHDTTVDSIREKTARVASREYPDSGAKRWRRYLEQDNHCPNHEAHCFIVPSAGGLSTCKYCGTQKAITFQALGD